MIPKEIQVKSVLNKQKKRDPWYLSDYSFNPYSSCSFNCLYCYIRGSKYGMNLADSLSVKTNAIEILDRQLRNRAKKGEYGFIVLSSITDPYLPIEEEYQMTRSALELILKYQFPVHIITKSTLITRDFDLLHAIDESAIWPKGLEQLNRGTIISFSFATIQDHLGKLFESGAPPPSARLETVKKTVQDGFLTGISLMPLIPYISDTGEQLEQTFSTFKSLEVDYILPASITLFGNEKAHSKILMLNVIKKHYPELEEKYNRFFANSIEMPRYYYEAFNKKMIELGAEYGIKLGILKSVIK